MKPLNIALALLPVAILAIGLIGWVVTLRGNLDGALKDIAELKAAQFDDTALLEQIQELSLASEETMAKVAWIQDEYGPAIESIRNRELDTEMADKVSDVVTRQAVVENEMRQIMSDHEGFADVLRELGEAGYITERREYGNYGDK